MLFNSRNNNKLQLFRWIVADKSPLHSLRVNERYRLFSSTEAVRGGHVPLLRRLFVVSLSHRSMNLVFLSIAALIVALPLFLVEGGCNWLATSVFPPRRPRFMPVNSVWIDAPSLPISWHHGWWFGCGLSSSGNANYCRLVEAEGPLVYASEYLPCSTRSPMDENNIHLVPPPDGESMWLFGEGSDGVVGFLANGDLLLPVPTIEKCGNVKTQLHPLHQ